MVYLLSKGINVNQKNENGHNILNISTSYCANKILENIILQIDNINDKDQDGRTAIFYIGKSFNPGLREPCFNTFKLLLDAGINLELKDEDGKTALDYLKEEISSYEYDKISEIILKHKKESNLF